MKLTENLGHPGESWRQSFQVTEVDPDDIPKPTQKFFDVVGQLKGFSFVNSFTADAFTEQVRERFATLKR
jgi:hypothetical protein